MPTVIKFTEKLPSVNSMYCNIPGKGRVKSKTYKSWCDAAGWEIRAQRPDRIPGPYQLQIHVGRDTRSKRACDLDNFIKPISDALVRARVIDDDYLCELLAAQWSDDIDGVMAIVTPYTPLTPD